MNDVHEWVLSEREADSLRLDTCKDKKKRSINIECVRQKANFILSFTFFLG